MMVKCLLVSCSISALLADQFLLDQVRFQRVVQENSRLTAEQEQLLLAAPGIPAVRRAILPALTNIPPLFATYPTLINSLPYISFASLPTPIIHCANISEKYNCNVYVKDDGQTGLELDNQKLFGGNKVRKLEFLLADVIARGYKSLVTTGCAESNHALATIVYANLLKLYGIAMLKPQHPTPMAKRNLGLQLKYASEIHFDNNSAKRMAHIVDLCCERAAQGDVPYVIPNGGSTPVGVCGYVNAMFELDRQIRNWHMPMPSVIVAPIGSTGTAAGMLLGASLLNLDTHIKFIAVEPEEFPGEFQQRLELLYTQTNQLLHERAGIVPLVPFDTSRFTIDLGHAGAEYALFTQEGVQAMNEFNREEAILLDGVYSGKAASGLLTDLQAGKLAGQTVLFWNTFCSDSFEQVINDVDYGVLPAGLQEHYEKPAQPLAERLI